MKLFFLTTAFFGVAFASPVSQIAIGPAVIGEEGPVHVDPAIIDNISPIAPRADDVTQTRTVSNDVAVYGNLIQYITHINGVTNTGQEINVDENSPISVGPAIDETVSPRRNVFRDVTQTSTLSNSGAIYGELTQYIIHVNGLTNYARAMNIDENSPISVDPVIVDDNAPVSAGPAFINESKASPSSNVFRDVTQTSTLSNSGAVTRDLTQYIIHINGLTTRDLLDFADQISVNGIVPDSAGLGDGVQASAKSITVKQIRNIVDKIAVNGIVNSDEPYVYNF